MTTHLLKGHSADFLLKGEYGNNDIVSTFFLSFSVQAHISTYHIHDFLKLRVDFSTGSVKCDNCALT